MKNITDIMFDLLERYEWMTAAFAKYLVEHDTDISMIPEMVG